MKHCDSNATYKKKRQKILWKRLKIRQYVVSTCPMEMLKTGLCYKNTGETKVLVSHAIYVVVQKFQLLELMMYQLHLHISDIPNLNVRKAHMVPRTSNRCLMYGQFKTYVHCCVLATFIGTKWRLEVNLQRINKSLRHML